MSKTINITISEEVKSLIESIQSKCLDEDGCPSQEIFLTLTSPDLSADEHQLSDGADSVFELAEKFAPIRTGLLTVAYCWDGSQLYGWNDYPVNVIAKLSETNKNLGGNNV